jgi:isopenicillin-N N-acyltransferase-like protein
MTSLARFVIVLSLLSLVLPLLIRAEGPFRYAEGKRDKGELKHLNGLPVLYVEGDPEEIGTQLGLLAVKPAARLLDYPKDYLRKHDRAAAWPQLVAAGKGMLPNFPREHLRELEATVKATGLDRDLFVAANTMFDMQKPIGCSVLMLEAGRSATGGPLFGRNLDFPTLGYLQEYTLVIVCRPKGKHAFVSVGFPGLVGCVSGMNDAGLTLAVLEVYSTCDGSPLFDPEGTPYALCFRRLLEECATVAEAEKLLRTMKRTTRINLAICDTQRSAVFEMTPKSVVVRNSVEGICACTNHFRTRGLATVG